MDFSKQIESIQIYNQYDGKFPILVPDYKDKQYLSAFEKLKTLIEDEQYSLVANHLAQLVLNKLASNYNGWYVKRMCFERGLLDLNTQILWTKTFLIENVKNFQGWQYRRFLIEKRGSIEDQFDYVDQVLEKEEKNYHVWAYKVQVTQKFNLFEQQKKRILKWLDKDVMNNSAWSYRHFLFTNTVKEANDLEKEIEFVFFCIRRNINNIAAWNYLRGWFPSIKLAEYPNEKNMKELRFKFEQFPTILTFCLDLAKDDPNAVQAMITLVHIHSQHTSTIEYALSICEVLATKQPFKETYWKWIHRNLKQRVQNQIKQEQAQVHETLKEKE